jgi:hypothetical protein
MKPRSIRLPRVTHKKRLRRMTVCIGALADDSKAIVCVADRCIAYSEYVTGDTDSVKILPLGENGLHVLIAGGDASIGRVLSKLVIHDDLGKNKETTKGYCESAYRDAEQEILGLKFLSPFLTPKDYGEALLKPQVNDVIKSIAEKIQNERSESSGESIFSCALILCGFDDKRKPFLLDLAPPGICTDMTLSGFCATGSGAGYALKHLLADDGWKRTYPVDRALYELFDAKIQAEDDPAVGYDSDLIVLTPGKSTPVPDDIKTMLDRAWIKLNRSPYVTFNPDEHIPLPPEDWMVKLKTFAESIKT